MDGELPDVRKNLFQKRTAYLIAGDSRGSTPNLIDDNLVLLAKQNQALYFKLYEKGLNRDLGISSSMNLM